MPSTISYQAGDVVLVDFPFTVSGQGKPRPALVILDTGDADVLLARVTTQSRATSFDVALAGWAQAGLLAPSIVRLHKLETLIEGCCPKPDIIIDDMPSTVINPIHFDVNRDGGWKNTVAEILKKHVD